MCQSIRQGAEDFTQMDNVNSGVNILNIIPYTVSDLCRCRILFLIFVGLCLWNLIWILFINRSNSKGVSTNLKIIIIHYKNHQISSLSPENSENNVVVLVASQCLKLLKLHQIAYSFKDFQALADDCLGYHFDMQASPCAIVA